jgi:hypothetical protein
MLDAYHMKKVVLNVKRFVIKIVKCKQSSILTSIQNTITVLIAKEQNDGSGNWPMSNVIV